MKLQEYLELFKEYIASDCWFVAKLPYSEVLIMGSSKYLHKGINDGGFAFAPFECDSDSFRTIISENKKIIPIHGMKEETIEFRSVHPENYDSGSAMPDKDYICNIAAIKRFLKETDNGKVVFSRIIETQAPDDLGIRLLELSYLYPTAFVFAFSSPESGTWYGATPELLLKKRGSHLETMALAGTRPAGTVAPWDDKNKREQRMVTEFIVSVFLKAGLKPIPEPTETRKAGPVEHLMTKISADIPQQSEYYIQDRHACNSCLVSDYRNDQYLEAFIEELSPTPAVCGSDRKKARGIIRTFENSPREYYGGFCGLTYNDEIDLYVNLRSAKLISGNRQQLHVGGGITTDSEPESEWIETIRKSNTLLKIKPPY